MHNNIHVHGLNSFYTVGQYLHVQLILNVLLYNYDDSSQNWYNKN